MKSGKTKRALLWIAIISGAFLLFIILLKFEIVENPFLNMTFRYSDKKISKIFENEPLKAEIRYLHHENKKIRYMLLTSAPNHPWIVFIHGAPGSSGDFINFFKNNALNRQFNLISIDRLGYGYSDFGRAETSMQKQAKALQAVIMEVCGNEAVMLVGHSYGGPIAMKMAVVFPGSFNALVLLAPAIDPDNEKKFTSAQLGLNEWSRWAVPAAWRVAAAEKMSHVAELRKLAPALSQIEIPVCHMHGTRDSLVPFENTDFSRKHIRSDLLELIILEKTDHFLPWTHERIIVRKILEMYGLESSEF